MSLYVLLCFGSCAVTHGDLSASDMTGDGRVLILLVILHALCQVAKAKPVHSCATAARTFKKSFQSQICKMPPEQHEDQANCEAHHQCQRGRHRPRTGGRCQQRQELVANRTDKKPSDETNARKLRTTQARGCLSKSTSLHRTAGPAENIWKAAWILSGSRHLDLFRALKVRHDRRA